MHLLIDTVQRWAKQRAHTATHLLHYALDHVLQGTKQAWSLVDNDYLRFDFAAKEPLHHQQITTLETMVNTWITHNCTVTITEMSLEDAKKTWAKAFFEDKYGDTVRVVQIPTPEEYVYTGNSTEFCGWTHVSSTWIIGAFKIIGQEAVASGVRRIEAVTGPNVAFFAQWQEQEQYAWAQLLDCSPKQITEKIQKTLVSLQTLQTQVEQLQTAHITTMLSSLTDTKTNEFSFVYNLSSGDNQLPLKTIVPIARQLRGSKNRLLYTNDGQFALCTDATHNAKELQQRYGLKGWWDINLIQWKDEKVVSLFV